jgi:hypothetical protein
MWTDECRARHERACERYSSDLSGGEWAVLAPLPQ